MKDVRRRIIAVLEAYNGQDVVWSGYRYVGSKEEAIDYFIEVFGRDQ